MTITQSRQTGQVRVHLSEDEAERLGTALNQISRHTPDPRHDVRETLEDALREVLA